MRIGTKVSVQHDTHPFTGVIEGKLKWENPFSAFKKKGTDYLVRADDDGKLYRCPPESIKLINNTNTYATRRLY